MQVEDASDLSDLELIQHMNMDLSRLTKLNGEYLLLDFPISLSLSLWHIMLFEIIHKGVSERGFEHASYMET